MSEIEFVEHSSVKLHKTNACDQDVALAARASFDTESYTKELTPERIEGLINFLVRNHHTSPLEHGSFTFVVSTPIFVAREFMRHRTWSFNEVSGRYSELKMEFYKPAEDRPLVQKGKAGAYMFEPGGLSQQGVLDSGFDEACGEAAWRYNDMLSAGIAKEVARMVLPVNTMTTFWATANPLNVLRFLKLRTDPTALYEIREVASQIEEIFAQTMPLTYAAYKEHGL